MMTRYYYIAGGVVRIEGRGAQLDNLHGFTPFRLDEDPGRIPFLILNTESPLSDWTGDSTVETLDTFPLENIECTFSHHAEGYAFRMQMPDKRAFLLWNTAGSSVMHSNIGLDGEPDPTAMRFMLWTACGLAMLAHRGMPVHSSVIVRDRRAVMFLGESGTGKSTHSRLWLEHIPGTFLLNDDSPILRMENGTPTAFGTPWSGKTPVYRNEFYPVAAIVRLSQGERNKIWRLSPLQALGALLPSCPPAFARDERLLDEMCEIISAVVEKVPVFHLECRPEEDAARVAFDIIFGNGEKTAE